MLRVYNTKHNQTISGKAVSGTGEKAGSLFNREVQSMGILLYLEVLSDVSNEIRT